MGLPPWLTPTKNEDGQSYDGPFSTFPEWHSATLGLKDGMRTFVLWPRERPDNPDVNKEPQYYDGAYVVGTLVQAVVLLAFVLAFAFLLTAAG